MEKQIVAIIIGIVLISLVSAIYAGECMEVDLSGLESFDNIVWDIVGNSSNTYGMNITFNETTKNGSVCFFINYKPDSFTIIFMDNSTKEIVKEVHHYSSGRSSTNNVYIENKTIEYRNITEYIDRERIINNTIDYSTPQEDKNRWIYYLLTMALGVIIGGGLAVISWKRLNEVNEEIE